MQIGWKQASSALRMVRRYWIAFTVLLLGILIWHMGNPVWAAPVAAPLNQTVPNATPTPSADPVATATPRPDEEDEQDDEGDEGDDEDTGSDAEGGSVLNAVCGTQEEAEDAEDEPVDAPVYTVLVTVQQLNVRAGAGTTFPVVGTATANQELIVRARNEDGSWLYVCCVADGETPGWVSADLVEPNFERSQINTLIPLFGTEAQVSAAAAPEAQTETAAPAAVAASNALNVSLALSPPFAWQGQNTVIRITVNNPNNVSVTNVELSDELPSTLVYVSAEANANGQVTSEATATGGTLVLTRWASLPPGGSATVSITVQVSPDLPDGAVVDNLVAVRATNAAYSTGAITIGMPPVLLPDF